MTLLSDYPPSPFAPQLSRAAEGLRYLRRLAAKCQVCKKRRPRSDDGYFSAVCDACQPLYGPASVPDMFILRQEHMAQGRMYEYLACFVCDSCGVHLKLVPYGWKHHRLVDESSGLTAEVCESCWHFNRRPVLKQQPVTIKESYMEATVRIHKRAGAPVAISTNAGTEEAFLAGLITQNAADEIVTMLPSVVDICCKLRGYKANVSEHRVIVAGEWLPDDVVEVFSRRELVPA